MSKVIFIYDGVQTIIQCLNEDKMKNICQKFSSKITTDINSLIFLYNGAMVNLELSFQNIINNLDKINNQMKILVYKNNQKRINLL